MEMKMRKSKKVANNLSRRNFVKLSTLGSASILLPINLPSAANRREPLQIGLIADVHKDIMHDADERLGEFLGEANKRKLDFIIQMGDFCIPHQRNKDFLEIWNSYQGDKYHILGNHDTDGGFTKDQTRAFWNMPANYYSFDKKGVHFIVLDGNDANPKPWSGYNRYVGKEQQAWLKEDLKSTDKPTIVFSHQTLELEEGGITNLKEVQKILEHANKEAGFQKVLVCLSGHHHTDFITQINSIYYVQINSASYRWVGDDYKKVRYSKEIDEKFEWIKYTIPYKDPLYTFMKIREHNITIEPRKTEFVGPGPKALNMRKRHPHDPIVPMISKFDMTI